MLTAFPGNLINSSYMGGIAWLLNSRQPGSIASVVFYCKFILIRDPVMELGLH